MLAERRAYRACTGRSLMVPRLHVVLIPAHMRDGLARKAVQMFPSDAIQMFPAETVQGMFDLIAHLDAWPNPHASETVPYRRAGRVVA